jgi:hypothetical protein
MGGVRRRGWHLCLTVVGSDGRRCVLLAGGGCAQVIEAPLRSLGDDAISGTQSIEERLILRCITSSGAACPEMATFWFAVGSASTTAMRCSGDVTDASFGFASQIARASETPLTTPALANAVVRKRRAFFWRRRRR